MQGSFFWADVNELARSLEESGTARHERLGNVADAYTEMSLADRARARSSLRMLLQELSDIGREVIVSDRNLLAGNMSAPVLEPAALGGT